MRCLTKYELESGLSPNALSERHLKAYFLAFVPAGYTSHRMSNGWPFLLAF